MKHLTEAEFIDMVMGDLSQPSLNNHLATCSHCRLKLEEIQLGLEAAVEHKPKVPLMVAPKISYTKFKRQSLLTRITWAAAAAILLLSFTGFRLEVDQKGFSFQFSLMGSSQSVDEEKMAMMESRIVELIELNAAITQQQLDQRFNAMFQDQSRDLGEFSKAFGEQLDYLRIVANQSGQ